jgi:arsenate reductase
MGRKHFAYLITVCAHAEENCPSIFPGVSHREHWPFDDPAAAEGTRDEKLAKFRQVRDQIDERIRKWVADQEGQN